MDPSKVAAAMVREFGPVMALFKALAAANVDPGRWLPVVDAIHLIDLEEPWPLAA